MKTKMFLVSALCVVSLSLYGQRRIEIVSHRGANLVCPENTFAAIDKAFDSGAAYVEVDLRTSKDGVMYSIHDDNLKRTTGYEGELSKTPSSVIDSLDAGSWFGIRFKGEKIPRVEDILSKYKGVGKLYFDFKDADLNAFVALVKKYNFQKECFVYFDDNNSDKIEPFIKLNSGIGLKINAQSLKEVKEVITKYSPTIIEVSRTNITKEIVQECRKKGIKVMAIGGDLIADYEDMIQSDVDMVNVDKPDVFYGLYNKWNIPFSRPQKINLIAHRGGVTEGRFPENSINALEAAIKRGYWMVEVDIRQTKDGVLIAQHDNNYKRFYNHDAKVDDVTWEEASKLKATDGSSPITFAEYCKLCKGRILVMLDIKPENLSLDQLRQIEQTLRDNDLLESSLVFSYPEFFYGKMRNSLNIRQVDEAFKREGDDIGQKYFIFDGANVLTSRVITMARNRGVLVVPALNTFAYRGDEYIMGGFRDARWLMEAGVNTFQLDSDYDRFFRNLK